MEEVRMFDMLINEYKTIVKYFLDTDQCLKISEERIYIDKEAITSKLEKYPYLPPTEKLKYWKRLRLLDSENGRLTRRFYDDEKECYLRQICIDHESYKLLQKNQNKYLKRNNVSRNLYNKIFKNNGDIIVELMSTPIKY